MIKKAIVTMVDNMVTAARIDSLIAELDSGKPLDAKNIRKFLKTIRGNLDLPDNHLSDQERADIIIEAVQNNEQPLAYSKNSFTQDFLANHYIPHTVRLLTATFLWQTFGAWGNPIWKNYIEGTFRYIEINEDEEDDN